MDSLNHVLLGLIAFASLVQAAALVVVGREAWGVLRRLDGFAERMGHDLHPALAELQRASESLAEVTDIAAAQARRVDRVVEEAVTRIERTTLVLQDVVVPSAGRLVAAAAAFRALRKGLQIFRRWRG